MDLADLEEDPDFLPKSNALIRTITGKDPNKMSDKKWSKTYNEIVYTIGYVAQRLEYSTQNAIAKAFGNNE